MQYTITSNDAVSVQAASVVRAMIIEGQISDGERINEVQLSQKLGISRTPLREGLGQLVAEQFVHLVPRRGFFAAELTPKEFSDLYDLRPLLDPQALILGGQPSDAEIDAIDASNNAFINATPGPAAVEADEIFHRRLLASCPNKVLLDLIETLMRRTQRYELALLRTEPPVKHSGEQHSKIIKALREHDLFGAAERLRENLTSGKAAILDWLSSR